MLHPFPLLGRVGEVEDVRVLVGSHFIDVEGIHSLDYLLHALPSDDLNTPLNRILRLSLWHEGAWLCLVQVGQEVVGP